MSNHRGSKGKTGNPKEKGQPKAGLSLLVEDGGKKPKRSSRKRSDETHEEWQARLATEKKAAEKLEKWRSKTKRKMKKSPRSTVREELPDVLVSMVEVAKKGSCPHAKILLDFADAENIPDAKEKKETKSLVEMLMDRLDG